MKSCKARFEDIVAIDNLVDALGEAARGKRHKRAVQVAEANPYRYCIQLQKRLIDGTWCPPTVHKGREINDGIRQKKRVIVCPEFVREQVVHHALLRVIAPFFTNSFSHWSCGSVEGRGQEDMAKYMSHKVKTATRKLYVCQLDVRKCFDTVSPDAILSYFTPRIRDRRVLDVIAKILASNAVSQPDGTVRRGGIPIGLYTSPFFANVILNPVDHILKDRFGMYVAVRFIDDITILHANKRELKRAVVAITEYVHSIGCEWKRPPQIHRFVQKIRVCGFGLSPDGRTDVHDKVFIRARHTTKRMVEKLESGKPLTRYDCQKLNSYASRFEAYGCGKALDEQILRGGKLSLAKARETISEADRADARKRRLEAEGSDKEVAANPVAVMQTGKDGQKDATVQDDAVELAAG